MMLNKTKLRLFFMACIFSIIACTLPDLGDADIVNQSITVNKYIDTLDKKCTINDCTLRDAIYVANRSEGLQEIILPGGLYRLNQDNFISKDDSGIYGDLDISGNIRIIGDGVNITSIDGMGRDRIFHVFEGASLELRGMTLFNGNPDYVFPGSSDCGFFGCGEIGPPPDAIHLLDEIGGGIIANRGYLKLDKVFVTQGQAELGGGILNLGSSDISNSNISGHTADRGGGIYNNGTISTTNTTIGDYGLNTNAEFPGVDNGGSIPNFAKFGGGLYNGPQGVALLGEKTVFRDNEASIDGGAIYNRGIVELALGSASFNTAIRNGGFIYNIGELSISNDFKTGGPIRSFGLWGNTAKRGGHIFNGTSGIADIQDTSFRGGEAEWGGAILNLGSLNVRRSFFSENLSTSNGSAIFNGIFQAVNANTNATLTNVTISLNSSGGTSSAAIMVADGTIALQNVTIALNNKVGIRVGSAGTATILNTILDSNGDANCFVNGSLNSLGHNIDSGSTCGFNTIGDMINTSAQLITNQFPGEYLPPSPIKDSIRQLSISPAINNGDNDNCPNQDQLKNLRPFGLGCDIGAIEVHELVDNSTLLEADTSSSSPQEVEPIGPVTADEDANCRSGPGIIYPSLAFFLKGNTADILGQNILHDWVFIKLTDELNCWVWEGTLTEDSVFENADEFPDPPTPTFTPSPTFTPTLTPTPTFTPAPITGSISGTVFRDANSDGSKSGDVGHPGASITLGAGACNSSGLASTSSNGSGGFSFTGLSAGTYCLTIFPPLALSCPRWDVATTNKIFTINLSAGQSVSKIIGFDNSACSVD